MFPLMHLLSLHRQKFYDVDLLFLTTPAAEAVGFFFANIPLTYFQEKDAEADLGEQLLREKQPFKRARSVPTTPSFRRYFLSF